jgi:F-type H+-transporting ATPase subunit b
MHEFLEAPTTWVALSFILFVALLYKPISGAIARVLDERAARIAKELDEALRLKQEAENVLIHYQQRQRECLAEAENILRQTREDATRMREEGETNIKLALKRRTDAAIEKIAQAETKAKQEVQNHLVDLAVSAARAIVAQHLEKSTADDLVRRAVSDVEHKIH